MCNSDRELRCAPVGTHDNERAGSIMSFAAGPSPSRYGRRAVLCLRPPPPASVQRHGRCDRLACLSGCHQRVGSCQIAFLEESSLSMFRGKTP